jgi:predicted Zn-dependent protease
MQRLCAACLPRADYWSLRWVDAIDQSIRVRQGILQPLLTHHDAGACITLCQGRGIGYGCTCDISVEGIRAAARRALQWSSIHERHGLFAAEINPRIDIRGRYRSPVSRRWQSLPLGDLITPLQEAARALKCHDRICDWEAALRLRSTRTVILSSLGAELVQEFDEIYPEISAVASDGRDTQRRSFGSDLGCQGGLEQLDRVGFWSAAAPVAEDALRLLAAPECPTGRMDLLLLPGQMALQLHESIGHPLELDRILGDERNYAGGSFVTPEMFGRYRYGSELLNVTFDPSRPEQLASYAFDDEGTAASREFLIRAGVLERPLGGACSQVRAGLPGVACARAESWHRPPIDRMANLNIEPGTSSLEALVGSIERGLMMDTNRSWSIDDQRNKFQFGCECGWVIEEGQVRGPVKNPNYRGVSASFWRNLSAVGDLGTFRVLGVATCGKGEPNQVMRVGHATPACVFRDVEVFAHG